jgi:hypothetical protein
MGQVVQPDVLSAAAATAGRRHPEAVETAAYLLVTVTVEDDGRDRTSPMPEIADRVGALDGILTVKPTWMGAQIPRG